MYGGEFLKPTATGTAAPSRCINSDYHGQIRTSDIRGSSRARSSLAHLMHHIDQRNHMVDRRFGQDTVSQIENMARTAARLFEDRAHAVANLRDIGKQRYRVKVALHGDAGTETLPGLRQIDAPIEADYVAPGLAHQFEQIARHRAEVNHGNRVTHRFDNASGMRQYETAIVVGAETSHP